MECGEKEGGGQQAKNIVGGEEMREREKVAEEFLRQRQPTPTAEGEQTFKKPTSSQIETEIALIRRGKKGGVKGGLATKPLTDWRQPSTSG